MPSSRASDHTLEVLDGGARLITAPLGQRFSASLALMLKVGSRYESLEHAGISHFIEHMVFKGSQEYPTSKEVAEAIEGVGGVLNAATDKELTMYWAKVPGDKLEQAVKVLSDVLQRPRLEPEEVEREREVIIEEIRMYLDSPADHVHNLFEEVLWPDHPLGVDIAGTEESLRRIGRGEMEGYMREHYMAGGLVIAVAGDVDHGRARELLEPGLARWGTGTLRAFPEAKPLAPGPAVRVFAKDTEQAHIVLGTRCVSYNHPDRFTIDLMNAVLGEGMSSRLFLEVREKRGLCYDVHSWASKLADTGSAGVYVGTEPGRAEEAIRAVMGELHRICDTDVGDGELTKAREYLKGRLLLQLEGTNSLATWLGGQELLTDKILEVGEIIDTIDAIGPEDVRRVARETYAEQPLRLAAVGPFKREEPLLDLIGWN
jgi:predicted Zn-dependent peptidase